MKLKSAMDLGGTIPRVQQYQTQSLAGVLRQINGKEKGDDKGRISGLVKAVGAITPLNAAGQSQLLKNLNQFNLQGQDEQDFDISNLPMPPPIA